MNFMRGDPFCECGKKTFSKIEAERFMKGGRMSRITKKKVHIYQCEISFKWHLSTVRESLGKHVKRKKNFNNRRGRQYW